MCTDKRQEIDVQLQNGDIGEPGQHHHDPTQVEGAALEGVTQPVPPGVAARLGNQPQKPTTANNNNQQKANNSQPGQNSRNQQRPNKSRPLPLMSEIVGVRKFEPTNDVAGKVPKYGVPASDPDALEQTMQTIDRWGCDIFRLADLTFNRPLTAVTYSILEVRVRQKIIERKKG